MGNEALTSPESASRRLQQQHLSLRYPFSLSFLIFRSSSPGSCLFLLSVMAVSSSFSSSSPHLPEEHPSPLLPPLSCVICPCASILIEWPLASAVSLSLPISFFRSPHLPCFLTIITAQFVVRIRPSVIKSALRLRCSCVFTRSVCVLHLDQKKPCSVHRHRTDNAGLAAHSP